MNWLLLAYIFAIEAFLVEEIWGLKRTATLTCEHEGNTYKDGEVMTSMSLDDPCVTCHCDGETGKPVCLSVMCAPLECADPDMETNKCCGSCPNGTL